MDLNNYGRYTVPENEGWEPGSNDQVLKNLLNIKSNEEMELLEEQELKRAELELVKIFSENYSFTVDDIINIHELWLGDIYPFAGRYRTVSMGKDGFPFANPELIPTLMEKFQKECLIKYTPCHYLELSELAYAIGVTHVELILIHPFREGNGRVARLLANLMAMQAKKPPLDFSSIDQTQEQNEFKKYIAAIHAGLDRDYSLIQEVFFKILEKSLSQ